MADGDTIEKVLSNPINWLAGIALGLGGLWLGSGFNTTGWLTGLLGVLVGIAGSAIVTEAVNFHPFHSGGSKPQLPQQSTEPQSLQTRNPWLDITKAMEKYDLLAAEKAGIETLPISKPEEYALRGKFRFRRYLQKQALANREISPQDPAIAAAIADLVKANNADGSLELVEVYLRTGDLDLAERTAKEGQAKFDDPRFKTALIDIRLEKAERKKPRSPGGGQEQPRVPHRQPESHETRLQQPQTQTTLQGGADRQANASRNVPPMHSTLLEFLAQEAPDHTGSLQGILPFFKKDGKTTSRA